MLYAAVFFLGSAAIAGILHVTTLKIFDKSGVTVQDALKGNSIEITEDSLFGLKYDPASIWGYFELHIEQGPVLELVGFPLAVVKGIAGQTGMKMIKQRHKVEREANIMPYLDGQRIRKLPRPIQSL
ncbi:hypothetical protein J1N35_037468 [Gossypium stocksii]|uniref:Uncharacterized protein n=1 Tax=Gossypium stocksii TaxID=47602 RepID=A0A9D3ZLQ5_9ROSI|nr:hypothetical protein J1N35_037468 [Gossypium stocksii]